MVVTEVVEEGDHRKALVVKVCAVLVLWNFSSFFGLYSRVFWKRRQERKKHEVIVLNRCDLCIGDGLEEEKEFDTKNWKVQLKLKA